MDQPDFRALCAELLAATQLYTGLNPAASEMSSVEKTEKLMDAMAATAAALATLPPEPPTKGEILQIALDTRLFRFQATAGDPFQYELTEAQLFAFARAILERWGK